MTRPEDAITDVESDAALACFDSYDHVVLAVSGGPDSIALLTLATEWRARRSHPAPTLSVATVDHCLRPESAAEAKAVADLSASLGVDHATLPWQGPKPTKGIPNAARQARYALLAEHSARTAPMGAARIAIVTAHTEDDQAETVYMRLSRAGGVRSLAAMPPTRRLCESGSTTIDIVRPFLAMPKHRLIATLAVRNRQFFEDPSNRDTAFERPRVRQALAASGLDSSALARIALRMQETLHAIDAAKTTLATAAGATVNGGTFYRCDRTAITAAPALLREELLRDIVTAFGGATAAPEGGEIARLAHRLSEEQDMRCTLGGAVVSAGQRHLRVWREPGRLPFHPCVLLPGKPLIWDARFLITCDPSANTSLVVRPLGPATWQSLRGFVPKSFILPAAAAHGLPAIYLGGQLLAVPQLGHHAISISKNDPLNIVFQPVERLMSLQP